MPNSARSNGPSALAHISLGGRRLTLVPLFGLWYLIISLAILAGIGIVLDRVLIPAVAAEGLLTTASWAEDNARIQQDMFQRNLATSALPVWHSAGMPLPADRVEHPRILVMGDSFVWGDGYANANDIWWRQLARELRWRGYAEVEVVAAGICGWNTRDQMACFAGLRDRFRPDLVIWGFVNNDPDEKIVRLLDPPAQDEDPGHGGAGDLPTQLQSLRESKRQQESRAPGDNEAWSYGEWLEKLYHGDNWEAYRSTLRTLGEWMRTSEVPMFMITLPNTPDREVHGPYFAALMPVLQEANIPSLDILDAFAAQYPEPRSVLSGGLLTWGINPANGHPGVISTRFYAVQAADYLEAHHPEVLGPKQPHPTAIGEISEAVINDWMPHDLGVTRIAPGEYEIAFSQSAGLMPQMPIGQPYVQVNLEMPACIEDIRLESRDLHQALIYVTCVDPATGLDDGELRRLSDGPVAGRKLSWNLRDQGILHPVNTVRIVAQFTRDTGHTARLWLRTPTTGDTQRDL